MTPAVFLDRDGVLIEDVHLLTRPEQIRILSGVSAALGDLKRAGYLLLVVSNQPVVARGMCSEEEVVRVNEDLAARLRSEGGVAPDEFNFCPHHPSADLPRYRVDCRCRKPRPGMILDAVARHDVDVRASYMVGDRLSDVAAGFAAGCRTILVESGRHLENPIESPDGNVEVKPDHRCESLFAAARWILAKA
jgi:D-glycero-D-manno-heptose 1,7-bisphosphate phosphatase